MRQLLRGENASGRQKNVASRGGRFFCSLPLFERPLAIVKGEGICPSLFQCHRHVSTFPFPPFPRIFRSKFFQAPRSNHCLSAKGAESGRRFSRRESWKKGFDRLCYRKWLMLFSLKLQRDNRKNALAVDPARGKLEKRLYFSLHCGDETTTYYNRAFLWL